MKREVMSSTKYPWESSALEGLVKDSNISSIQVISYDNVRIKKDGVSADSGVRFGSPKEYERFVNAVVTRNALNLRDRGVVRFVDTESFTDIPLHVSIMAGFLSATGIPAMNIRKLPNKLL